MTPDLWVLYRHMLRSRRFEEATARLWKQGLISGEMHLGIGEEAVVAGVVSQLIEGDALALDHRGTPPLVMRGADLAALLLEMLGHEDGLCRGQGGHMHFFAPDILAASSGIVGAAGPAALGFALANQHLRPGCIAVAFWGEGAMNQGMVLEALNLAAAWTLPVLFVCRNNDWAITTKTSAVTEGNLLDRAASFGLKTFEVDGTDVEKVWGTANTALAHVRGGDGPVFLLAHCPHLEGHFLGDPLLRIVRNPAVQLAPYIGPLASALAARGGAGFGQRLGQTRAVIRVILSASHTDRQKERDPLRVLRKKLIINRDRLRALERDVTDEIAGVVKEALTEVDHAGHAL